MRKTIIIFAATLTLSSCMQSISTEKQITDRIIAVGDSISKRFIAVGDSISKRIAVSDSIKNTIKTNK